MQQPTDYAAARTVRAPAVYPAEQPASFAAQRTALPAVYETQPYTTQRVAPDVYAAQRPTSSATPRTPPLPTMYETPQPMGYTTQQSAQAPAVYETLQPTGYTTQRTVETARPDGARLKESSVPITPSSAHLAPPSGVSVYTYGSPAGVVLPQAEPAAVPAHTHHGVMDHLLHTSVTGQDLHDPEEITTPKRSTKREFLSPGMTDHDGVELPLSLIHI